MESQTSRKKPDHPSKNNPRRNRKAPVALPSSTVTEVAAQTKSVQEAALGEDMLSKLVGGASVEDVAREAGVSKCVVLQRVSTLRKVSPEVHRQMVEGLRLALAQLAMDDMLHWRPRTREERTTQVATKDGGVMVVPDYDGQKLALSAYKDSKDTIIKVFGLQSQTLEVNSTASRPAMTSTELAAKSATDPDVREAVEAIVLQVTNTPAEERAA